MSSERIAKLIKKQQLEALAKGLPNTFLGDRFARLQRAKELNLTVVETKKSSKTAVDK